MRLVRGDGRRGRVRSCRRCCGFNGLGFANTLDGLVQSAVGQRALQRLLIRREMVARTSGTLLGGAWMVVQPALQIVGLWFFLDVVLKVRSPGRVPFVNYFLVGMIGWMMMSEILQRNLTVLVEFGPLYQRTIFPLPLLPLLPLLASLSFSK